MIVGDGVIVDAVPVTCGADAVGNTRIAVDIVAETCVADADDDVVAVGVKVRCDAEGVEMQMHQIGMCRYWKSLIVESMERS